MATCPRIPTNRRCRMRQKRSSPMSIWGVTAEQQAFYVDLMKKVRETPDWKEYMEKGAFNQSFMAGAEYVKWVENAEKTHRQLMTEAGFLNK